MEIFTRTKGVDYVIDRRLPSEQSSLHADPEVLWIRSLSPLERTFSIHLAARSGNRLRRIILVFMLIVS
jgi:hypothetical protein